MLTILRSISTSALLLACILHLFSPLAAAEPFHDAYIDVVWSDLLGVSSYSSFRTGLRDGEFDYSLAVHNDYADTTGTDLPYQYRLQGTTVSVGVRRWFADRTLFASASAGIGVAGDSKDEWDARVGMAGYRAWERDRRYTDLYGELFWIERAGDVFFNLRYRPGLTLARGNDDRLWTYAVGQVWASGEGTNGTENRLEAGIGLGYLFAEGHATANLELRVGHVFQGTITDRTYFNPTIILAGSF